METEIAATTKNEPLVKQGPPPWANGNKQKHHQNKSKFKNK